MRLIIQLLFWVALAIGALFIADRTVAPGIWDRATSILPLPEAPTSEETSSASDVATPAPGPIKGEAALSTKTADDILPANRGLRINAAGLQIIKQAEGLRLEAYEAGGKSYIGYGHQMAFGDPRSITEAEAERLLKADLERFEDGVKKLLTRPATQNQFSAMVSLAYTLGVGRFGTRSDVLVKFNRGDVQGAADAFRNHNRGGGVVLEHLAQRREKERTLFLTPG